MISLYKMDLHVSTYTRNPSPLDLPPSLTPPFTHQHSPFPLTPLGRIYSTPLVSSHFSFQPKQHIFNFSSFFKPIFPIKNYSSFLTFFFPHFLISNLAFSRRRTLIFHTLTIFDESELIVKKYPRSTTWGCKGVWGTYIIHLDQIFLCSFLILAIFCLNPLYSSISHIFKLCIWAQPYVPLGCVCMCLCQVCVRH